MFSLIKRNLLYTIRDRIAFLMSFLSVIILIIIYKAFLGNFQIDSLKKAANLSSISTSGNSMINLWLISGLVVVTSVTSVLGALNVFVEDHVSGKQSDFKVVGASQFKLLFSYYISALILGFFVTLLSLIFGIMFFLGFNEILRISLLRWSILCLYIFICNIFGVLLCMPIVIFLKSRSGFTSFSTIVGTLIGFVSGIYISIGNVTGVIKRFMLLTPLIHESTLIKNILMSHSEHLFFNKFPNHIRNIVQVHYDKLYGNRLYIPGSGKLITLNQSLKFIILWIIVLFVINVFIALFILRRRD